MKRALLLACGLVLACEAPSVEPSADPLATAKTSRIDGQIVVQTKTRGDAIVLLFDADHPPPPEGTGQAVSFAVVPEATLFGGDTTSAGPFTAPFHFSLVKPGRYLLRGFVDRDGCAPASSGCVRPDFNPFFRVTREPNTGDVGGAAIDASGSDVVFTIAPNAAGALSPVTGATVSFGDVARVPVDRPVFSVEGPTSFDPAAGVLTLTLDATPIDSGAVHEGAPVFLASYVDDNHDGQPDLDGSGQPLFFPRVYVRKIADAVPFGQSDENDLDNNGLLDPSGVSYVHADGSDDGKPDAVVLAAAIDSSQVYAALNANGGQPVPLTQLTLHVQPLALDASDPANPQPLQSVPSGQYAITIVSATGQTWRVPNELHPRVAPGVGLPAVDSQSYLLAVP
jgi:hypothetical protein